MSSTPATNPASSDRSPNSIHVVVGAGATGTATALLLADSGERVRVVTRSGNGPAHPGVELVAADAADEAAFALASEGAAVIYNCANPPYHRWTTDWPPVAASLLAAAERHGAVLATLSNLYGYAPPTAPMKPSDPLDATSVKGGVRAAMWHEAKAAHDAGRVRAVEVRASDFIGPGIGPTAHMGDRVVPRVLAGKSVSLVGRTDVAHSWTAIADVAAALVAVGRDERAWGRAWHVPTAPPMTQEELVHRMCWLAGVDPVKVKALPSFVLTLAGMAVPAMREMKEVLYQFEAPFVIDSSETTEVLGLTHTPIDDTLTAALDSYREPAKQLVAV